MKSCAFKTPALNQRRHACVRLKTLFKIKPKEFAILGTSSSRWQIVQWLRRNQSFYQNIQSFWRMEEPMTCPDTSSPTVTTTTTTLTTWPPNVEFLSLFLKRWSKTAQHGDQKSVKNKYFQSVNLITFISLNLYNKNLGFVKK